MLNEYTYRFEYERRLRYFQSGDVVVDSGTEKVFVVVKVMQRPYSVPTMILKNFLTKIDIFVVLSAHRLRNLHFVATGIAALYSRVFINLKGDNSLRYSIIEVKKLDDKSARHRFVLSICQDNPLEQSSLPYTTVHLRDFPKLLVPIK